jgi:cobyrinic acid a,c-diamide synthase
VAAQRTVAELGEAVAAACDLTATTDLARSAPPLPTVPWDPTPAGPVQPAGRVALAAGPAFTFVYQEHLELLAARGIELAGFDPTVDETLPADVSGLYLGGGFPETFGEALAANLPLRAEVRAFAAAGHPVVAECGGLLYLCRALDGQPMCGVIAADAQMTGRLTLGYRRAVAATSSPLATAGQQLRGHEFHYSVLEPAAGAAPAWRLDGHPEGFAGPGLHASYLHTHWAAFPEVADRLAAACAAAAQPAASGRPA